MSRWICVLLVIFLPARALDAQLSKKPSTVRISSENFDVVSFASGPKPAKILLLCEKLREELARVWGGNEIASTWQPRCEIVVHDSQASYLAVVGPDGGQTTGCSLIQLDKGKVVTRRIDLIVDSSDELSALPHELTHVVLADRFHGRQPPHWLDEGIAMLADTPHKQSLHERDCHEANHSGKALPISEILHLQQFSSADQMPAFYGQSLSLVRMLSERKTPDSLVPFALDALDHGFESSLKTHYALDGIHELQREWKKHVFADAAREKKSPIVVVSFKP